MVFIHGLWLLPSSWDRWAELFAEAGYPPVQPGWPDDPRHGRGGAREPAGVRGQDVGQIADHLAGVVGRLHRRPVIVGHSFGGLFTQILAGRGLATVSVAIDPAPFRGVLPLPVSSLKSARPVLGDPATAARRSR